MPIRRVGKNKDCQAERDAVRAGILTYHVDMLGKKRAASPDAIRALLDAIGPMRDADVCPASVVPVGSRTFTIKNMRLGARPRAGRLLLETGGELDLRPIAARARGELRFRIDGALPLGVHEVVLHGISEPRRRFVLARPRSLAKIVADAGRRMAVFLPVYAMCPGGPSGVGTYTDLRDLCAWAQEKAGALVGTLPLFSAFLDHLFDPSPYAPVSRLMWSELFVDPQTAPEWCSSEVRKVAESAGVRHSLRSMRAATLVDYRKSWSIARRLLRAMASVARSSPARWAEVLSISSAEAARYAIFRSCVDATGTTWQRWPASWRAGMIDSSRVDPRDVDLYIYAQTLAAQQMAALRHSATSGSPLYLDLPVGVHAGGFDTFTRPDLFLHDVSAGAPPDPLNASGQVWVFPPMHPTAGRADGYAHLRAVLRRMLGVAGVLRIDHVMGLYRMYCVPRGHDGSGGAYLRYPEEELLAVVLIEAARAGAMVVGEDLGTVPPEVQRIMRRSGVLGMHVQQFAFGCGSNTIHPAGAHRLASLNTHDTPTFAGFWNADDIATRQSLRHLDAAGAARESVARAVVRRAITKELKSKHKPTGGARSTALSLMQLQARGPAPITLVNLEDLWGERRPQNVPGTLSEYPNWRRKASKPLRAIIRSHGVAGALAILRAERRKAAERTQQ